MAVETLTDFPSSLVAGDTLRVSHSDSRFPSTSWSLKVSFKGATVTKTVDATATGGGSNGFTILATAAETAELIPPGLFAVSLVYTETASGERATDEDKYLITVFADPTAAATPSIARQTLVAMQAALLLLSAGSHATVNFNGQSFTKRNILELQKAIEHQRAIVAGEDGTGRSRIRRILYKV